MKEQVSVYDSNKGHTNPLITMGVTIMGIFAVINILYEISPFANADMFDRWHAFPCYGLLFNVLLVIVVILGCNCTKNKNIFNVLKYILFLPMLLALIVEVKTGSLLSLSVETFYVLFFTICSFLRLLYLILGTVLMAKGLFKQHKYKGYGHLNMSLHIMLLLVVPVFYKMCRRFRTTSVINKISNEPKRNAFLQTLLCYIVPFYSFYWTYTTARRSDVVAVSKGLLSNTSTLCLILHLFIPVLPPMIIQDKINQVVSDDGAVFKALQNINLGQRETCKVSVPDELKKYKELLDCGAITQEEYNKKKSELLNM